MKEIVSSDNAQFKLFTKLLSARKYRQKEGSYLAEGLNGLDIPAEQVKAYLLPQSRRNLAVELGLAESKVILLADALFKQLSLDPASQGLILWLWAQNNRWQPEVWQPEKERLYLAVEDIQDPGNLGTMIRTAEAAGVGAVFCSKGCVDLYHPKVLKAAASSVGRLPVYTEVELPKLLLMLKQYKIRSYAAALAEAVAYAEADYTEGAVFLIGNEGNGLSRELLKQADFRVTIPMSGQIESLNAAISAAVLLFEAKRQGEAFMVATGH